MLYCHSSRWQLIESWGFVVLSLQAGAAQGLKHWCVTVFVLMWVVSSCTIFNSELRVKPHRQTERQRAQREINHLKKFSRRSLMAQRHIGLCWSLNMQNLFLFFFGLYLWLYWQNSWRGNRKQYERKGNDMQQSAPGRESNPGQSLCKRDDHSSNRAKRCPWKTHLNSLSIIWSRLTNTMELNQHWTLTLLSMAFYNTGAYWH